MESYVTLEVCPICREDTGTILLDKRMRDRFEMHTINPTNPCDKCREKYLKEGVLLINPETCSLVILKNEAFKRMFNTVIPKGKICFAEEGIIQGLMQAQVETDKGVA